MYVAHVLLVPERIMKPQRALVKQIVPVVRVLFVPERIMKSRLVLVQ